MTPRRKRLILSVVVIPVLVGIVLLLEAFVPGSPKAESTVGVVLMLWAYLGTPIFAALYASEVGASSGGWWFMSMLVPFFTPALLACISRPTLPPLVPETMLAAKSIRDWNLGEPIKAFGGKKVLGTAGAILVLTTQGFISDDKKIGGVAWHQVKEIYRNLVDFVSLISKKFRVYDLVLEDGRKLRVDQNYDSIDELGRHLELQVSTAQHAAASVKLERGEPLRFGPVTITPSGFSWGRKQLPWNAVESVGVNRGHFVIARRAESKTEYAVRHSFETVTAVVSRFSGTVEPMLGAGRGIIWQRIEARRVPNICLLIAMAEGMMSKGRSTLPAT